MTALYQKAKNVSASGLVKTGAGSVKGIFVASATTGTIKLWDNTAGSGPVLVNTFTVAPGVFYELGHMSFATGLFITIGGTVDCTIAYD